VSAGLPPDGAASSDGFPDDEAFSTSFRLTVAFLKRYPGYRQTLLLQPEHARFDPVLWNSSLAALQGLLLDVAEQEGLSIADVDVREAVRNLVEGVIIRSRRWGEEPPA
jgi:hypothetical protein